MSEAHNIETQATPRKNAKGGKGPALVTFQGETSTITFALETKQTAKAVAKGLTIDDVSIDVDLARIPTSLVSPLLGTGVLYYLRQTVNSVKKQAEEELQESGAIQGDLTQRVRDAVMERLNDIYNGELGRRRNAMSPVDRRAWTILRDAIASKFQYKLSNEKLDEATDEKWNEQSDTGAKNREILRQRAAKQIEEERQRASVMAGELTL